MSKEIKIILTDNTTSSVFPKTLIIRNSKDGMIWQVYHIQSTIEAYRLAGNATNHCFYDIRLEDYDPTYEETWPDWRDTDGGKSIINDK